MKKITILVSSLLMALSLHAQVSEYIHVDQFGYTINAEKVAVLSDPQEGLNADGAFTPGTTLEIRRVGDDSVAFTGSPAAWNGGATHAQSGDKGWWFDFSTLTEEGDFYMYDVASGAKSAAFTIGENPYYDVMKAASKMFYYNRCNAAKEQPYAGANWADPINFTHPLQDANCRYINDPGNAALEKDLTGGWFDAGDYNKYTTFAHSAIQSLLTGYEETPDVYGDNWNLPESGNGVPDILDELKWELDWLYKMTNEDGTAHIKMGSQNYAENVSAPPSSNTDQRFYGPTCTSASVAAASAFAHAAKVFGAQPGMDGYANTLTERAVACWGHFKSRFDNSTLETECDTGQIVSGDADWTAPVQLEVGMIAAVYLYELTDNDIYKDFFEDHYNTIEPVSTGFWGPYKPEWTEALLLYTQLPDADTTIKTIILNSASTAITGDWESFLKFSENDLYRAQSPDWIYHWGSNIVKANIANLCNTFVKYNVVPGENDNLRRKAAEQLHYFHGINPLGKVYLSNMYDHGAERCADEIYHAWFNDGTNWDNVFTSLYGPAPGYLTGGPNANYGGSASLPAGQPIQKAYADFNSSAEASWEITEPAIYYQAAYVRLLGQYTGEEILSSGGDIPAKETAKLYPNPAGSHFSIAGIEGSFTVKVIDVTGKTVYESAAIDSNKAINTSALQDGVYIVKIIAENGNTATKKLVKKA